MAKKAADCGVRVYGNQYGHWVVITDDDLYRKMSDFCLDKGITHERFIHDALEWYIDKVEAEYMLELEHQERMVAKEGKA